MNTTTYAEQAAEYRRQSDRAFAKADRADDQAAIVRAIHEGRRLARIAEQYETLASS
jgi:NADPH-dependent glutamate synthase beta subunit-like oxidoreductase